MCTGFQAIERYLNLCDELNVQEDFLMTSCDQQVPRTSDYGEESLDENTKCELQEIDELTDPWIYSLGVKNAAVYPPDVVYDQELSNEAPPDLLDLDQCHENFYERPTWDSKGDNSPTSSNDTRNDLINDCNLVNLQTFESVVFDHKCRNIEEQCRLLNISPGIESMVFDHKSRNIEEQCRLLNISPDPRDWSWHHVTQWIASVCRQYNKPLDMLSTFERLGVNGQDLCKMSEADFKERCPEAGSLLFNELEMWKTVRSLNPRDEQYDHRYFPATVSMPEVKYEPCMSPTFSEESISMSPTPSPVSSTGSTKIGEVIKETWGLPSGIITSQPRQTRRCEHKQTIQLWRFLRELLHQPEVSCGAIKWVDQAKGIFKIEDSSRVAKLWGKRKNRPLMNYDKLSRSIRQYYKKGIIKKTEHSKRLVYQFCDGYL